MVMMKTVNTVLGLTLFVVLGGFALGACKNNPVQTEQPACCDLDAGTKEQSTPASSTETVPTTDSDAGVVDASPSTPSKPEAK
jgi:hypothetical protein